MSLLPYIALKLFTKTLNITKIPILKLCTTSSLSAGHSKWANIKHIKALKDGQKAAIFTKLSRQIRLAIQEGGSSNPAVNSTLRQAIDHAVQKNMPMSTIQNTIKKCEQNKLQISKHILEMRAFNKIYLICILYTDNFLATKMLMAPVIKKAGATFVDASHLFENRGVVELIINNEIKEKIKKKDYLEELCTEHAIECGAEEVEIVDFEKGIANFICDPVQINRISSDLTGMGYKVESAEHVFIPKAYVTVPEKDLKGYETFLQKLKAFEGVEEIYDNLAPIE